MQKRGDAMEWEPIGTDTEEKILLIPHLGVTLRTLLGAAAATSQPYGQWRIQHRGAIIGTLLLKPFEEPK